MTNHSNQTLATKYQINILKNKLEIAQEFGGSTQMINEIQTELKLQNDCLSYLNSQIISTKIILDCKFTDLNLNFIFN